jgi:hypothetical protein
MELEQIGFTSLRRDTRCAHCGGADPEMALQTRNGIEAYHFACVKKVKPRVIKAESPGETVMAKQLELFT